jgi:hypothetical protein
MSQFYGRNFHNFYMQKNYYGHIFLMPPEHYVEFLKKVYSKFKNNNGPKTLFELKRLALEEAKKASTNLNIKKESKSSGEHILSKEDVIKILKAIYEIIDPLLVKMNQNFKNERRKNYEDNDKYLEIIKSFEKQKVNLITFTIKSVCKRLGLRYSVLQESVFKYIQNNEEDVISKVNSFTKIGKVFALAPKKLSTEDIIDILKIYYENLNFMILNSDSGKNEYSKFSLTLINDLIYENYGLEEEQIFAFIEERNLTENKDISITLGLIQNAIRSNLSILFEL